MPEAYSRKLEKAFTTSQLCVGIDPHSELLVEEGLADSVQGLEYFSFKLLEELSSVVSIVKPQVSFFERFGSSGFAVLEKLLLEAQSQKMFTIVDVKRGDIGSTMDAYGLAWLAKSAPFVADAITVNPFLGLGTIEQTLSVAIEQGKGIFCLCATSNPEALSIQTSQIGGVTLSQRIATDVAALNDATRVAKSRFGNLGLVVGATVDQLSLGLAIDQERSENLTPILAPGFGHQGARLKEAGRTFFRNRDSLIASISRSALRDGLQNVGRVVREDVAALNVALKS
ncbi:MAG: orotidine-5'-phosphate decarboxylase [Rhodoluna sp.]